MISAKVVADSIFKGERLTTLEIELHRFILPEFNTHRSLSRNFQSSRAVPVSQMIEQVRNNPAMPVHWGKNQPGMQANEECNSDVVSFVNGESLTRNNFWKMAAKTAATHAEMMSSAGYHKQLVNRLLEPFMWTKGVVTARGSAWDAFFQLRLHKDAQPEIRALAEKILEAMSHSIPQERKDGDWHLPYFEGMCGKNCWLSGEEVGELLRAVKVSASCCGQVSYRKLDDSLDKAIKIYDMLNLPENGVYKGDPPHFSPTEHQVKFEHGSCKSLSGNFQTGGFIQYRKALEHGIEKEIIKGE